MSRDRRVGVHALAAAAVFVTLLAGCGSGSGAAAPSSSAPATGEATTQGTLTVFAAASLKNTFTELGQVFEEQNPGAEVMFSFAGSSDLVAQIIEGAPADVYASADLANMAKATDAGLVDGEPVPFASNSLTIVVPAGNPAGIGSFADLANPGVAVVVCAPQVPCGSAAVKVEDATGVSLSPVSEESSVTDVLNKVVTGEADAGLVYVTDAAAAGDSVESIASPEAPEVVNTYPIAVLTGAHEPALARAFSDLVAGPQGRQVLAAAGFAPVP